MTIKLGCTCGYCGKGELQVMSACEEGMEVVCTACPAGGLWEFPKELKPLAKKVFAE